MVNTCDINYRTARNKRLTVELCLVQLTQLGVQQPVVTAPQPVAQPKAPSQPSAPSAPKMASPAPQPTVAQPKVVAAPPKMSKLPTIPSLNATPQPVKETTPTPQVESSPKEENSPFTLDQFRGAWAGLYTIFKEEPRLLAILKEYQPELIDQHHCVLTLANPWQKNAFKQFGKAVMDHMRETLHNSQLQLTLQVDEQAVVKKAYTAEEKYKVLLEKNEELANLKSALGLQLE